MQRFSRGVNDPKITSVELLRGCAALLVVLFHGHVLIGEPAFAGVYPFGGFFAFGHAGVEFFFVLSGFIMYFVHEGDIGQPQRWASYAWKRAIRIYPFFWFVLAIHAANLGASGNVSLHQLLLSSVLWPQASTTLLVQQSWTLSHEMLFYILFGVAILNRELGIVVFGCWAAVRLGAIPSATPEVADDMLRSPHNMLFYLGMVVGWLLARWNIPAPRLVAGLGGLGFLMAGLMENAGFTIQNSTVSIILFGISSAVLLLGMVSAERAGLLRTGRLGRLMGQVSYPLYLMIHIFVLSVVLAAMVALDVHSHGSLQLVGYTVLSWLVALALHRLIERPIGAALNELRLRWLARRNMVEAA